ncbi:hypothetical protein [Nostoc sp.]|uniref:hypothetical protein n=1 Tax=Nostoc sp. TaxID=1180 RepID=UPI002FFB9293
MSGPYLTLNPSPYKGEGSLIQNEVLHFIEQNSGVRSQNSVGYSVRWLRSSVEVLADE